MLHKARFVANAMGKEVVVLCDGTPQIPYEMVQKVFEQEF